MLLLFLFSGRFKRGPMRRNLDKKVNGIIFMDVGELKGYGIFRLYKTGFQEGKSFTFETGISDVWDIKVKR